MAKYEPLVTWRVFEDRSSRNSSCRKYPKFFGSHRVPWNKRMEWKKLKYESKMVILTFIFFSLQKRFFLKSSSKLEGGICNFDPSYRPWLVICRKTTLVRDTVMMYTSVNGLVLWFYPAEKYSTRSQTHSFSTGFYLTLRLSSNQNSAAFISLRALKNFLGVSNRNPTSIRRFKVKPKTKCDILISPTWLPFFTASFINVLD